MAEAGTQPSRRSEQFLAALREGDARAAERAVHRALRDGLGVTAVQDEVIAPALRQVGVLWALGEMSVADEHLATAITYRVLGSLSAFVGPPDASRGTVLLATVEGERHVVGLEMVARVLEGDGYDVKLLGADVPTDALAASVARFAPAVVGLSSTLASPETVREAVEAVQAVDRDVHVLLGGAGCPPEVEHCRVITSARGAVEAVSALLARAATA